ncbi:hypothetical protein JCM31271_31820 [Halorubrum trueperi]
MSSERHLETTTDQNNRKMSRYLGMLLETTMGASDMGMKMSLASPVKEILDLGSLVGGV